MKNVHPSSRLQNSMIFEAYERLIEAAQQVGSQTYAVVLLDGDAGLRSGKLVALGKSGRIRHVPMAARLMHALRVIRHLRSRRVLCREDGSVYRRQNLEKRL
jgi:hypothetical protein